MGSKTPLTDAALDRAEQRMTYTQQFDRGGVPKEFADHARRLESALQVAEEALRPLANIVPVAERHSNLGGWRIVLESGSHAEVIKVTGADAIAAREALRAIEKIKGGMLLSQQNGSCA